MILSLFFGKIWQISREIETVGQLCFMQMTVSGYWQMSFSKFLRDINWKTKTFSLHHFLALIWSELCSISGVEADKPNIPVAKQVSVCFVICGQLSLLVSRVPVCNVCVNPVALELSQHLHTHTHTNTRRSVRLCKHQKDAQIFPRGRKFVRILAKQFSNKLNRWLSSKRYILWFCSCSLRELFWVDCRIILYNLKY